jgi:enoyl-CoA hydratase
VTGAVRHALTDGVLTVTFDNPPYGYFIGDMAADLLGLLPTMAEDDVRVVVLAGALEGVFVRHYSVEELVGLSNALRAKGLRFDETTPVDDHAMNQVARGLEALPKPVIAAINGTAMGGGWELAMACDIRIGEAGPYSLGLPEVNLGILPGAGGTQRLARLVGTARALEMALCGRTVTPDEAVALGMVHEVAADARARAHELATELAGKPPKAVAHVKRLVRASWADIDADTLQLESRLFMELVLTDEANTRMAEFVDGNRDIRDR